MKNLDNLDAFVESVVSKDDDKSGNFFSKYLTEKMSTKIQEFTGNNPIKLKGDDVFVNGKQVGTIDVDLGDFNAGISFITSDRKFSKEFDDMESLYKFLADRYNVRESEVKDFLEESIKETEKALKTQDAKKKERIQRWIDVKKQDNKDGSEGEYDKHDLSKHHKDELKDKKK